jgi:hypothetical protein
MRLARQKSFNPRARWWAERVKFTEKRMPEKRMAEVFMY